MAGTRHATTPDLGDTHPAQAFQPRRRRPGLLIGLIAVVALIWGSLLPRLATQATISRWIEANQTMGVDPAAMYYSDLDEVRFLELGWKPAWKRSPAKAP